MKGQLDFPQHIVDVHLYHEHVKKMAVRGDVTADIQFSHKEIKITMS